jgi:DNA polymerase-3 subunit alpha
MIPMAKHDFVHLHVHSHYSLLDGLGKIDDLLFRANELGMNALALTDHGAMYGTVDFYEAARKIGIKPILGCELYVSQGPMTERPLKGEGNYYHLLVLAENDTGYKNLMKLVTEAHLNGYYYRPRVDKELLRKHHQGLIASSGCLASEIPRLLSSGNDEGAKKALEGYLDIFGKDSFYLELQDHPEFEDQKLVNRKLSAWAKEYDLPVIVTADTHYVRPEDKDAHEVLLAVQQGKLVDDADRLSFAGADFSLKDPAEIAQNFAEAPEALSNTVALAERCNVKLELGTPILPQFPTPKGIGSFEYLRTLVDERLPKRYGRQPSKGVRERLDYEMKTIEKTGFADYFLIVADYVNWAKEQGIVVGWRGSAGGSIVSYILGITDLDPIAYGLLFERFLNPERPAMPDIDIDFQDDRREEVIRYVTQKYGDTHVAQIITFGVMKARLAVRDVTRALGLPYQLGDQIAKQIPMFMTLDQAMQSSPELKRLTQSDPNAARVIEMSKRLEGVVRHASTHAAGVVIGREPLVNYTPLQLSTRGELAVTTQYAMGPVEDLGLLKMDILGLANLTIIKNCLRIVRKVYGEEIDIEKIPLDDRHTFDLYGRGETIGTFQFESGGMREYLKRLKPTNLNDLIAMVALYRPGPIELIPDYINAKHGRKKVEYLHPTLEPILKDTYGIMVYQEQVMEIAQAFAGFSKGEGYVLVKGIAKKIKEIVDEQKERFIEGAVKKGHPKRTAEQLFKQIEPFARYGFNRAHSACYALLAYRTTYLKAHYPAAYMAAVMTSDFGNQDRIAIEIEEASRMGIEVLPPDVNESFVEFGIVPGTGSMHKEFIRFGLSAIKNVGVGVATAIQEVRQKDGPYASLEDFLRRLGSAHVNRKVLESLIKAGALDRFGERNQLLAGVDLMLKLVGGAGGRREPDSQLGLFQFTADSRPSSAKLELPPVEPVDKTQRLAWEKELLGLYLTDHPLKEVAPFIRGVGTPMGELGNEHVGHKVRVAGIITNVKRIVTKGGQQMAFVNLEDTTGRRELIVFPKVYNTHNGLLVPDRVVVADGTVNVKEQQNRQSYEEENEEAPVEEAKILVDRMWEIGEQGNLENIPPFEPGKTNGEWKMNNGDRKTNPSSSITNAQLSTRSRDNEFIEDLEDTKLPPTLYITIPKQGAKEALERVKEVLTVHPGEVTVVCRVPANGEFKEITAKTKVELNEHLQASLAKVLGDHRVSVR